MIRAIRPVVVVLLAQLIIELWPKAVGNWRTALVGAVSFVAIQFLHLHPALAVLGALAAGALWLG
jgi:chromate transport protein ChrA